MTNCNDKRKRTKRGTSTKHTASNTKIIGPPVKRKRKRIKRLKATMFKEWLQQKTQDSLYPAYTELLPPYLLLPQLRGLWPMSSVDENMDAQDLSAQGRDLTNNNAATYGIHKLVPYVEFDGTGQSLSRPHDAALAANSDGELTFGGWFYLTDNNSKYLMSSYGYSPNQNYYLVVHAGQIGVAISRDGASVDNLGHPLDEVTIPGWVFVVGKKEKIGSEWKITLHINNTTSTLDTPYDTYTGGNSQFMIGDADYPIYPMEGKAALCFFCATAVPESIIRRLFAKGAPFFGY